MYTVSPPFTAFNKYLLKIKQIILHPKTFSSAETHNTLIVRLLCVKTKEILFKNMIKSLHCVKIILKSNNIMKQLKVYG